MTTMPRIYCQYKNNCKIDGCIHCAGYGYMLEQVKLPCCGNLVWVRPGAYTSYEGIRWNTFDGIEIVNRESGRMCGECDMKVKP